MQNAPLILFHAVQSRSFGTRVLLEELQADYRVHFLDLKTSEQLGEDYLRINPFGKVPAVLHGDLLISEQVALTIYLADLYPASGLAHAITNPLRDAYLRWIAQYGCCFEPAVADKWLKREAVPPSYLPYRDLDSQLRVLGAQLEKTSYLLGDAICAADILWGTALRWLIDFDIVPKLPVLQEYVARVRERPAVAKVENLDNIWIAEQQSR
ncbi:MAG: glutathione S-transferase family protein [Burkholderiales bacterium]|nr:glutathione S-transferase family protein [Burkholderiales bacterium]